MADSDTTVDVRVTPAFISANVRALPQYDTDTAPLFGPVESAFDLALQTCISIHDAREAAKHDLTLTDNARLVAVADFADKVLAAMRDSNDPALRAQAHEVLNMMKET